MKGEPIVITNIEYIVNMDLLKPFVSAYVRLAFGVFSGVWYGEASQEVDTKPFPGRTGTMQSYT